MPFGINRGGDAFELFEYRGQVLTGTEADFLRDIGERGAVGAQHGFGSLDALAAQVGSGRESGF